MESWVYIFSRFTPEALLFEALLIFLLMTVYAVVWIANRKRVKADSPVPAGVIKEYLGMLISDAEYMRAQLFGLLNGTGQPTGALLQMLGQGPAVHVGASVAAPAPSAAGAADGASAQQIAVLEAKMAEQAKATENLISEKDRLQKDLEAARAGAGAAAAAGGDSAEMKKLQEKIAALEARLAEYSVIEDDLANLKRLQQENAQLKAQLQAGGGAAVAAPAPAAAAAEPALAAPATEAAAPVAEAKAEPAPAPAAAEPAAPQPDFEALVDDVEKSLKSETPAAAVAAPAEPVAAKPAEAAPAPAAEPAAAAPASTAPAAPATMDSSEADLVAEFEKMLNG